MRALAPSSPASLHRPQARRVLAAPPRPPVAPRRLLAAVPPAATALPADKPAQTKRNNKRNKDKQELDGPYRGTVTLPVTEFSMRANSTTTEPALQAWWRDARLYEALIEANKAKGGAPFTLHDGPPYANGDAHLGHALNKCLKSFAVNWALATGRVARYVPGWDCHGLPIELKVLQSLSSAERKALTPTTLRARAKEFALATVAAQSAQFQRYGVLGEWDAPYLTLDAAYEAAQLRVFGQLALKGHVYRGRKPVHWSPSSRTALAEAELEYPDNHVSRSVWVALDLVSGGPAAAAGASLAVWTTTPWTLPANAAVAVNPRLEYAVVTGADSGRKLVVARDRVDALAAQCGEALTIDATFRGADLDGATYAAPLPTADGATRQPRPVVAGGEYITADSGTGLVHTAPGHGADDYATGLKHGLPLLSPVDDAGRFTEEAGPGLAGLAVLSDGNEAVVKALTETGALLSEEAYNHKYPYDWRTKKPTIFRATDQWFVSVAGFRQAALDAAGDVQWIPASGARRIATMIEGRSDWCISRQRAWGVPIPVLYRKDGGEPLLTEESVEHIAQLVERGGSDVFWSASVADLLPPSLADQADAYEKRIETMDVWFDSGSSWAGALGARGITTPVDLYLEGSDQHRGWFQSSLLTHAATAGGAPYKTVLTHGFALDEKGAKMSKSLGNVVDPRVVVEGGKDAKKQPPYGADVLRLWVASVDYTSDVAVGPTVLAQCAEAYRKLRGTLRFVLGSVHGFDPATHAVPYEALPLTDRYALSRLAATLADVAAAYDTYNYARAITAVTRFATLDLSNWYLDTAKDRLYIQAPDSPSRRACQTVLAAVARGLVGALLPVTPHLAEDAWRHVPWRGEGGTPVGDRPPSSSAFAAGWAAPDAQWSEGLSADDAATFATALDLRSEVNAALQDAQRAGTVGATLDARAVVWCERPEAAAALRRLQAAGNDADELRYCFITSAVDVADDEAAALALPHTRSGDLPTAGRVTVGVGRAGGGKCDRCWAYSDKVGADARHPALCERCAPVVVAGGMEAAPAV